ncbi:MULTISPECIES: hypothetical protein [Bacillus]|uniref:hypothetical protein n=2 Tax=Bacillaceae TaxID=186817 RepID=UPI00034AF377|nr:MULTISPECIES: hypothetical protein [Bacillus cereus group]MCO4215339.1 hypothetical protein [Bacillus sp. 10017]PFN43303.1 hypothetical protein COJ56_10755 [Bacillus thuringiensis]TKV46186.1 hypothetical protein C1I58_23555 [Bacillus sp. PIC28]KXY24436.1 histidine kinase [Bacillus cereus]MBR9661814.1 hypothetical protein [Bacillus cereus]
MSEKNKSVKLQKFEELGEKRMNEAIKKIRLIGNLANRNNYDYTDEHVKAIISTLESEIQLLKNKFRKEDNTEIEFKFRSKK